MDIHGDPPSPQSYDSYRLAVQLSPLYAPVVLVHCRLFLLCDYISLKLRSRWEPTERPVLVLEVAIIHLYTVYVLVSRQQLAPGSL